MTPYRLVTAGADGLARTWDIREACLKRYGRWVGKRPEYRLDSIKTKPAGQESGPAQEPADQGVSDPVPNASTGGTTPQDDAVVQALPDVSVPVPAPPLPPPAVPVPAPPLPPSIPVPAPPLPPPADANDAVQNPSAANVHPIQPAGLFVANDKIDEGVKLLSKLQHGAAVNEQHGPGTRARRSTVKVICVARCPHGGHFATGSDDGICRIWLDDDDPAVKAVDDQISQTLRDITPESANRREGKAIY